MLKFLRELASKFDERRPYKTKVVYKSIDGKSKFALYYKKFHLSKYRQVKDSNGNPMLYETYVEAAAAAYMASITSLKFFNS